MKKLSRPVLSAKEIYDGIVSGKILSLSRAITLIESQKSSDQNKAERLLTQLLPLTGNSIRIGITGSPGVGKSTFIEAFGKYLTSLGKKIAVMAIDPSSEKNKGSILGDKTRMTELATDPRAFIRPSPAQNSLGGVAEKTREAIMLCEAAGFDVILVETVGVGQSETAVRNLVDFFLLLQLAGAGDELQGIKKGIMEMADGVVITKADGENEKKAKLAQVQFQHALHLFQPSDADWRPKVLITSAAQHKGMAEVWKMIEDYKVHTQQNHFFNKNREQQKLIWFHERMESMLRKKIFEPGRIASKIKLMEQKIKQGQLVPSAAAKELLKLV